MKLRFSLNNQPQGLTALETLPLDFLASGETGCICDIDGDPALVTRLAEMGFRSGVSVRMIRPGQPCIVALDHQRVTFRGQDAALILVQTHRAGQLASAVPAM